MIMNKTLYIICAGLVMFFSAGLSAQEQPLSQEQAETLNLGKIADDMKFQNGVLFIKLGLENKALEELQEYLEIYNRGIHRNEAFMKIGDIYFGRMDYYKAQKYYRSLYEEYSDSDDGVEAYYKVGLCYKKMGYRDNASVIFNEILKEHGGSSFASQASLQIDLLSILSE